MHRLNPLGAGQNLKNKTIMKISVIIPTYNRADKVREAIGSVQRQTYPAHEIIVVDDGSRSDAAAIVAHEMRVKYIYQTNAGISVALNNAILQATGDWIAILGDDDLFLPVKLEECVKALKANTNCSVCVHDSRFTNNPTLTHAFAKVKFQHEAAGVIPDATERIINPPHGLFTQSSVISRQAALFCPFDPGLRVCEDTDIFFRLSLRHKFCYINQELTQIDRTPKRTGGGLTDARKDKPEIFFEAQDRMYRGWLKLFDSPIIRRRLAEVHNGWGNLEVSRGNRLRALDCYSKANLIKPKLSYIVKVLYNTFRA